MRRGCFYKMRGGYKAYYLGEDKLQTHPNRYMVTFIEENLPAMLNLDRKGKFNFDSEANEKGESKFDVIGPWTDD